jgi:hypothetical protein
VTRYIIPVGDPALEKLEFSAGYINEELGDLDSERYELIGGLTQAMGRWQRVLFFKSTEKPTSRMESNEQLLLIPGISYAACRPISSPAGCAPPPTISS